MNNSIYVIGAKDIFLSKYDEYEAKGFVNRGSIRFSNDDTLVLVEEAPEMFEQSELDEALFIGNQEEIKVYLSEHQSEWQIEEPL